MALNTNEPDGTNNGKTEVDDAGTAHAFLHAKKEYLEAKKAAGAKELRQRLHKAAQQAVKSKAKTASDFGELTGGFTRSAALKAAAQQAIVSEFQSFTEAERELWDFTRCLRDNGSVYGSRGRCRKGREVSDDQAELLKASKRRSKRGAYGGTLKQRLRRDTEFQRLAAEYRDLEKGLESARTALKKATEELEADRWGLAKRAAYKEAQQRANAAFDKAERKRSELKRRQRELERRQRELERLWRHDNPKPPAAGGNRGVSALDRLSQGQGGVFNKADWLSD